MKKKLAIRLKKKYKDRATPFVWLWEILKSKAACKEGEDFCVYTTSLQKGFDAVLDALRSAPSDFVFIHGVNNDAEVEGLLCTDSVRMLADIDSTFFVGTVSKDNGESDLMVINSYQLVDYLGSDAGYRIGYIVRNNANETDAITLASFRDALNRLS